MNIDSLIEHNLNEIYQVNGELLFEVGEKLKPKLDQLVDQFYGELLVLKEVGPILENAIVQKNLKASQKKWIIDLLQPNNIGNAGKIVEHQKKIGSVHANLNVNLKYFTYGISILKKHITQHVCLNFSSKEEIISIIVAIDKLFDIVVSLISESYFSNEMIHETNELSLKMKGMTQNTAIECERLRSMLLDWLRTTLTHIYQAPTLEISQLPKLQYSSFGLWVIYKADLLSHTVNISSELRQHIDNIDAALVLTAKTRGDNTQSKFFDAVNKLNEEVSKASWYITSIVDRVIELDTGMDTLTRLFNRRYLETILRRQTEISIKRSLPYSILLLDIDSFKQVNDNYGHDCGDAVLKQFAELLLLCVRSSDFVFRYGGEEFMLVLSNIDVDEAKLIAEKIRHRCELHSFRLPGDQNINKTCSIGIAAYSGHPDFNRIIKQADEALFEAKEGGRNQVCVYSQLTELLE